MCNIPCIRIGCETNGVKLKNYWKGNDKNMCAKLKETKIDVMYMYCYMY